MSLGAAKDAGSTRGPRARVQPRQPGRRLARPSVSRVAAQGRSTIRPEQRPSAARAAAAARLVAGSDPDAPAAAAAAAAATAPAARLVPGGGSAARAAAAARLVAGADRAVAARVDPAAEPAAHPAPAPLQVVEPVKLTPAQRRRRARALLLAGGTLIVAVALGLVYFHVVLAQRQFALNRLDTSVQNERATYERLRLQVAQLGSPQHIISTAEGQLGMRQPASVNYLTPTVADGSGTTWSKNLPSGPAAGRAPAGDADWPLIKSQLAGSP